MVDALRPPHGEDSAHAALMCPLRGKGFIFALQD